MENLGLKKIKDVEYKGGGIYFIYNKDEQLMYIGKSINIRNRLLQHISPLVSDIDIKHNLVYADYIGIENENERANAEVRLINQLKPKLNRQFVFTYDSEYYSDKYNSYKMDRLKDWISIQRTGMTLQEAMDKSMENFFL